VIGHILFSVLDVTVDGAAVRALAIAPISVKPERQRHGIASARAYQQRMPIRKSSP
jgi:putative acetyltransferase